MFKSLCFAFLLLTCYAHAQIGTNWVLKENSRGIKIFTGDVETSKVKAIRVQCEVEATLSQVVAMLMDIKGSEEWLYHTSSNYIVKQVSPSDLYYYSLVNMPWPVSNRDFIAHLMVSQNPQTKVVTIDAPCNVDMVPAKPGIVRIANSKGKWILTPTGSNGVKIDYTLQADPGGLIPAWLTNMFATEGPSQSFKKFKVSLQKPAYRNAKIDYIVNW